MILQIPQQSDLMDAASSANTFMCVKLLWCHGFWKGCAASGNERLNGKGPLDPHGRSERRNSATLHFDWGLLPNWSVLSQNLPQFRRHPGRKPVKGHDTNLPWYDYFLAWYAFVGKRWPLPKKVPTRSFKFFRWPSPILLFGTFLCYIICCHHDLPHACSSMFAV